MEPKMDRNWYLLQSKVSQHDRALYNLESQGYECFSPNILLQKRRRGKKVVHAEPLFPGYIFINLDANCSWRSISSTRGVSKFVRFGPHPTKVPCSIVDSIKKNIDIYVDGVSKKNEIKPGDLVNIIGSSFEGYSGVLQKNTGNDRSLVLIKVVEQCYEIEIEQKYLNKSSDA